MSEVPYLAALKTGDTHSFKELYNAYFPVLYNYAVNITKAQTIAEDAVSEVFLKLWEGRSDLIIETSLKAYLFKSVYHQSLNVLKHTKVRDKYKDFFTHHLPIDEKDSDYPLSGLIEHEITEILQKTIDRLPEQCRRIFIMSRIEHMKHEEIAQELGISVNTVRTQIRRALEKLRVELKDFLPLLLLLMRSN